MRINPSNLNRRTWLAVVIAATIGTQINSLAGDYLRAGATPLRFSSYSIDVKSFKLPELFTRKLEEKHVSAPATDLEITANPALIESTRDPMESAPAGIKEAHPSGIETAAPSEKSNAETTDSTTSFHPAEVMLPLSPQMVIDYFKPGTPATNASGVSLLLPVEFVPPLPPAPPSSRAVYKVE